MPILSQTHVNRAGFLVALMMANASLNYSSVMEYGIVQYQDKMKEDAVSSIFTCCIVFTPV